MNVNLSGNYQPGNADESPELLGGWLRDHLRKACPKTAAKLKKMPKWARVMLACTGVGLLAPATTMTLLTTGVATAAMAAPIAASIAAAKKAKKVIAARIAAKKAAQQDTAADEAQYAQVSEIAAQNPAAIIADHAAQPNSGVARSDMAAPAATSSKLPLYATIAGGLLTVLSMLKK